MILLQNLARGFPSDMIDFVRQALEAQRHLTYACYLQNLPYYPIFLNLKNREVLVVGAGKVGLRKVRGLLAAGAQVIVVAPMFDLEFETLPVRIVRRRFRDSDLAAVSLVFAATNSRAVNRRIGSLAKRKGILANIADSAAECDFLVPARVSRGDIQIAISTGGVSPGRASEVRKKLEQIL